MLLGELRPLLIYRCFTQAVAEDDVETLNWMVEHELVDLAAPDALGNTAAHLAVFHDSPRSSINRC